MNRNEKWLAGALITIKLLLPFLLSSNAFGLHRDEYLYFEQGRHLDWGFLENPPLLGLLARISAALGGSLFVIRLWPALFGAATLWLLFRLVKGFGGGFYALLLAGIGYLLSVFLRIHILFQPTILDVFFWTAACLYLQRYLLHERRADLYALAVVLALGWWGKYSVLFYIVALFIALLLTPQRRLLGRRDFWLAAGLGALIVLPNVLWQYRHHWPLAHHMAELRETQLKYLNKSDFLLEQVKMFLPAAAILLGGLYWLLRHARFRAFGWLYIGIIFLLVLGSAKGYYSVGIYPMLLAAGGVWLEEKLRRPVVLRVLVPLAMIVLGLPMIWLLLPLQPPAAMAAFNKRWGLADKGVLKWEDQHNHLLQQDFADMIGWDELARKAYDYYDALPSPLRDSTVIYARNYGFAGSLLYHVEDTSFRRRVICDNGTFLLWIPDTLPYRHLLFVGESAPERGDEVFEHFEKIIRVDSCTNPYSRQYGSPILFFENADTAAFRMAERGLRAMKAEFGE
ncbi:glycosyltransferase family 39 protein [Flaviaesturariibacter aridisoli]|nr:glycosyltransferase family 39 protein [Flaviaesturariibacter aridisoli]